MFFFAYVGMSFGEEAGLYMVAHLYSYRALTTVDIIALDRRAWSYLLPFFPASIEEIDRQATAEGIKIMAYNEGYD